MATPNITAGAGDVEKAQQEQAESMRQHTKQLNRLRELTQKKLDKLERQAASAGPMSIEDAVMLSGLGENANLFQEPRTKFKAPGATIAEADRQGKIERDKHYDELEKRDDAERKASQGALDFATSLATSVISVSAFVQALNRVAERQAEAGKTANEIEVQRGQAMQGLRYSPQEQERRRQRAATGRIPGNITAAQESELFALADQTRGMLPGNEAMRSAIDDLIYDPNIPIERKRAAIQQSPQVANVIGRAGGRGPGVRSTREAQQTELDLNRTRYQAQFEGAEVGNLNRAFTANVEAEQARGTALGHVTAIPFVQNILEGFNGVVNNLNKNMRDTLKETVTTQTKGAYDAHDRALKNNTPPPSTNAGR